MEEFKTLEQRFNEKIDKNRNDTEQLRADIDYISIMTEVEL